jgi:hypothetical protein
VGVGVREVVADVALFVKEELAGEEVEVENACVGTGRVFILFVDKALTLQHAVPFVPTTEEVR